MGTLTERLAVIIDAKTSGAVSEFGKVGKAADDLDGKGSRTSRTMEKLGLSGAASGAALKAGVVAGAGAAAAGLVALGKSGVDAYVGLAAQVRDFQRISGATAETSSRFVAVLDDMGVSAEVGGKAIGKLARASTDELSKFGVEIAKNADGTQNLEETLLNVADAYANTNDPAQRAKLSFAAFGRQGQDLIPVLEQGRAGLADFFAEADGNHQILSQEEIDKAREYELAMDALGDASSGLQREIGQGLLPTVIDSAEALTGMLNAVDSLTEPIGGLSGVVGSLASAANPAGWAMKLFGDDSEESGDKQEAAKPKIDQVTAALEEQRRATEETVAAQQELIDSTIAAFSSELGYENAVNRVSDAQADLATKQRELTEAQKAHKNNSAEVKAAEEALADAERGLRDAQLGAAGAAARVAEDQAKASGASDTAKVATEAYRAELGRLRDAAAPGSPLRAYLDGLIGRLDTAANPRTIKITADASGAYGDVNRLMDYINSRHGRVRVAGVNSVGGLQARASGGPVSAGNSYLVGEEGPEVVTFDRSGYVIPNGGLGRAVGGGGVQIIVTGPTDPAGAARAVRAELLKLKASGMSLGLS